MTRTDRQLPLEFGGQGSSGQGVPRVPRGARRERVVRLVEYTTFPRVSRDPAVRVAFTRDESATGMCLGADRPEAEGGLMRVVVRGADGRPTLDGLARVVWCRERGDGRWWIGVALLQKGARHLRTVPSRREVRRVAITA